LRVLPRNVGVGGRTLFGYGRFQSIADVMEKAGLVGRFMSAEKRIFSA